MAACSGGETSGGQPSGADGSANHAGANGSGGGPGSGGGGRGGATTAGGGSAGVGGTGGDSGGAGGSTVSGDDGGTAGTLGGGMDVKGPTITITEFTIPTSSQPGAICAGPDGKIWFVHQSTAPTALGNLTTAGTNFALVATPSERTGPTAITGGVDGNIWYTRQLGMGKATPAGMVSEFVLPAGGDSGGIVAGPDGNMWFTEPLHDRIGRSTAQNAVTTFNIPTTGGNPFGITKGPDGNLWFTESAAAGNKIGKITPAGVVSEYKIPTPSANAQSITAGSDGNIWFTEFDARKIGRITAAGVITEFSVGSDGKPFNIATGSDGNLWFTEGGNLNLIGRITPMGAISEYPIPSPSADAAGITAGPDKNIWFAELSTNKIARISNLMGGGTINSVDGRTVTAVPAGTPCVKDTDCVSSGMACGGDVCSATGKVCALSNTGDPGTCVTAADCWCMSEGATCSATHHCSTIVFDRSN
jgi:streptogramin lyase